MSASDLAALPVSLDLPRSLRDEIQRHLEAAMGWQVTTSLDLPARLHLYGVGRNPARGVANLLVVTPTDSPAAAAASARLGDEVVSWPDGAGSLPAVAARLLATRTAPSALPVLRVGGAAGGVGTTTVALALAGLLGWRGLPTLLVSASDVAVPDVPAVGTLRGPRPWEVAATVPGVPNLRVAAAPAGAEVEVVGPDLVVDDLGGHGPHLLVASADRAGLHAITRSEAGAVVIVERGPLETSRITAAAGPRLAATLPWSDRVARAGLQARVPSSLPGSWLARLDRLAERIGRDVHRTGDADQRGPHRAS